MNQELKNKENRKKASLTINEWLTFFLVPVNFGSKLFPTKDFNDNEEDRFAEFGFEKKIKQSRIARVLGIIFYVVIIVFVYKFIKKF